MKLDANKIMQDRIAKRLGLLQYGQIMQTVNKVDVSENEDFQRRFNGYYRVRRNAEWRKTYYDLFEKQKTTPTTFRKIITKLYNKTGNIEASFSSKMLATLHPDQPIWDSIVLECLGFRLTGKNKEETLNNAILLYSRIRDWYAQYLNTSEAGECIKVFDATIPNYIWISNVKKIDFFIWSNR